MKKVYITDKLSVNIGAKGKGSVVVTCENCKAIAQFRKKNLYHILLFIREHLHSL